MSQSLISQRAAACRASQFFDISGMGAVWRGCAPPRNPFSRPVWVASPPTPAEKNKMRGAAFPLPAPPFQRLLVKELTSPGQHEASRRPTHHMCYNRERYHMGAPMSVEEQPALQRGTSQPAQTIDRGEAPLIVIEPSRGWIALRLRELWLYRELIYFLVWRDVKVRYKQTALGAAWAIIQPFFTMIVFSIFFGRLAGIKPDGGIPYPIFSYAALVPWTFFANGLSQASNSLVGNANLIKKVYFPRLVVPIAAVLSGVIDFVLAFAVLLALMLYYGVVPTIDVLWLPLLLLLAVVTSLG